MKNGHLKISELKILKIQHVLTFKGLPGKFGKVCGVEELAHVVFTGWWHDFIQSCVILLAVFLELAVETRSLQARCVGNGVRNHRVPFAAQQLDDLLCRCQRCVGLRENTCGSGDEETENCFHRHDHPAFTGRSALATVDQGLRDSMRAGHTQKRKGQPVVVVSQSVACDCTSTQGG